MHELHLICPENAVESISDALGVLDALSVSVTDADADTGIEQAMFGEPGMPPPAAGWVRTHVTALFADEAAARHAVYILSAQDFFDGCTLQSIAPVVEQDWVALTQSQFEPVAVTSDFWIVPSWHEVPKKATRVIRLDPGMAFGTGTHPTTRMCLRWIAANPPTGQRVLDYGCGSGILAIAAALYGADPIDAVDIDVDAVDATRANAAANGVNLQAGSPEQAQGRYQTVMANILATPLKVLAPLLAGHVAEGGALILAGILERQTRDMQQAYAPWLQLDAADREDGWVLLTAHRS